MRLGDIMAEIKVEDKAVKLEKNMAAVGSMSEENR